jgi:hypothetical protein
MRYKNIYVIKSSSAIFDDEVFGKVSAAKRNSSGAIISIDGTDAGSEPNFGAKTA